MASLMVTRTDFNLSELSTQYSVPTICPNYIIPGELVGYGSNEKSNWSSSTRNKSLQYSSNVITIMTAMINSPQTNPEIVHLQNEGGESDD